jgi:hypothetical protein
LDRAPETPESPPRGRHPRSSRGAWTIVAIFAVGLAVLGGLMLVPRNKPPAAPARVPWGTPQEPVTVVACDLSGRQVTMEALAGQIEIARGVSNRPDFVMLQHVGADDALVLARVMGMQASYRSQHHQRVRGAGGGGASDLVGVALLSKHPLYEGGPLRIDKKRSAGVSAVAVVGSTKFRVACVYAADAKGGGPAPLLEQQKADTHPPALVGLGGEAGAAARYREMLSAEFTQGSPSNEASGISLLLTRHWRDLRAGGTAGSLTWYVVGGREPTAASTRPAG